MLQLLSYHSSIGGYHGAKLGRYQELIDSSLVRNISIIQTIGGNATSIEDFQAAFNSTPALNMLNTRYVIFDPDAPPLVNQNALGNAWFIETPIMVDNANEEMAGVNRINPSREAVIDNIFKDQVTKSSYPATDGDKIELKSYKANELSYTSITNGERIAVFSDIYYPAGWKCFIDGEESSYFRTNYVLRGMVVPAGEHEISFIFKPSSYIVGNKISLASSVILILLTAGYFLSVMKKKQKLE